jgi:hypothetical protein
VDAEKILLNQRYLEAELEAVEKGIHSARKTRD